MSPSPDEMDGCSWHFTYGANMCSRILVGRRGLRPLSSEPARLDGYRLTFSLPGLPYVEPVFANIEEDRDGTVHGVLHRIRDEELAVLDRIEAGYASVDVTVAGSVSGEVVARAYHSAHVVRGLCPSRRYLALVCEGAREFGLPEDYVRELARQPTVHSPLMTPVLARVVKLFESLRRRGWLKDEWIEKVQALDARMRRRSSPER